MSTGAVSLKEKVRRGGQVMTAGDLHAERGSERWAIAVRAEIGSALHNVDFNANQVEHWMQAIEEYDGWRVLYDEHGEFFTSFEDFCAARSPYGLGRPRQQIGELISARKRVQAAADATSGEVQPEGRPKKLSNSDSFSQGVRAGAAGVSRETQSKLDYLARHAPELLERVRAGELATDKAYRLARGLPPRTTLDVTVDAFYHAITRCLDSNDRAELKRRLCAEDDDVA